LFGEPKVRWHPIALIGRAMGRVEAGLFRFRGKRPGGKLAGVCFALFFAAAAYLMSGWLSAWAAGSSRWLGFAVSVFFLWTSISVGELLMTAKRVNGLLDAGRLDEARNMLRSLVGRDTGSMSEAQIREAALESVAENLVDAGIAPLFYAFIGGAPLAFAYRVVNTLDSMFGYKTERYRDFGWASARLDDIASWLPARLTVLSLAAAGALKTGKTGDSKPISGRPGISYAAPLQAVKSALTDGRRHPSPNSGLPMAALAGLLEIRLGGPRSYRGRRQVFGYFGPGIEPVVDRTIGPASALARRSVVIVTVGGLALSYWFRGVQWLVG
jgi:adenosylcobinamide-phosphate synthase